VRAFPIAAVIACAARVAVADGIGVAASSVSSTSRTSVAQAMRAAIGEQRRMVDDAVGQARGAVEAGAVAKETLVQFKRVRDLVDEGWRAYLHVELEFAQARLSVARQEAEAIAALPGGAEIYADSSLRLGIVLGQLGHADEARAALRLALAIDPERPITIAEFAPDVVAAVDAVRAEVPPSTEVSISTTPPTAAVTVDGKAVAPRAGVGGFAIATVTRGQHVVVARAVGFRSAVRTIAAAASGNQVGIELEPDPDMQALETGAAPGVADAGAQRLVDATLRFAELDEVVLAIDTNRLGGNALLVQRCAGSPVATCTAVVEIGYAQGGLAEAAREAWRDVHTADLRYPPSVFADPRVVAPPPPPHRCEWCRSPYLWGGVGAVAVIGTIAIIAVATSSRPPPVVGVTPGSYVTP
jgi:hypothetical protein